MNSFSIRPIDVYDILRSRSRILAVTFVCTFALVFSLTFILPKRYRAQTVVHIGVNYFQNPLIQDMVASTYDPTELRAQREGLLRKSLNEDFGNKIGDELKIMTTEPGSKFRAVEVSYLLKSIDVSPITSTQYKIAFKGSSPEAAYGVIKGALNSITETMYNDRLETIRELRDAINTQLGRTSEEDGDSSRVVDKKAQKKQETTTLSKQLEVYEQELRRLRRTFSEQHPRIMTLNKKIADINAFMSGEPGDASRFKILSEQTSENSILDAADDLKKKSDLLSIALEIESKDPTMRSYLAIIEQPVLPVGHDFPKARTFLIFALVAAVMSSTFMTAVVELYARMTLRPKHVAEALKVKVLDAVVLPSSKT